MTQYRYTEDWTTRALPLWQRCFKRLDPNRIRILEIGCFEGRSSCWFSNNMLDGEQSVLHCVDPYTQNNEMGSGMLLANAELRAMFEHNIALSKNFKKITHYDMSSDDFFATNTETYNFVYVDGGHKKQQVIRDLINTEQVLEPNGFMVVDDVWDLGELTKEEIGVREALIEISPFRSLICLHDGVKHNHKQSVYQKVSI